MSDISITDTGVVVDARIIGAGFGLDPAVVPGLMRSGQLTSRSEIGEGEDAGFRRLTFYFNGRALRLTVNASGEIVKQATFDTPNRGPQAGT